MAATAEVVEASVGSDSDLIAATLRRFRRDVEDNVDVGVTFTTTIPRSVGLAGSSAIVIAALRALFSHVGIPAEPQRIATLAHDVERVELGIAGGWQDQTIQSRGVSGLMEFGNGQQLTPIVIPSSPEIPLYLAWSEESAEPSGQSHEGLRSRANDLTEEMHELAALARRAASAIEHRDVHKLKTAIDATFDIRRTVMPIASSHDAMVRTARNLGAVANFAGSGGAIVGVLPKDGDEFVTGLREAGLLVRTWTLC